MKTIEELRAAHPDLCAALVDEGRAAGLVAGAEAERTRIQAVEAQVLPGHEALIASLKFDGKTSGPEAAAQVLAAERIKLTNMAAQLKADAPKPVPHAAAPDAAADQPAGDPLYVKAKAYQAEHPGTDIMTAIRAVGSAINAQAQPKAA